MFAKDKPTKKVTFDGGWAVIQHLSKGVKDELQKRLSSMVTGMDEETVKKMKDSQKKLEGEGSNPDFSDIPTGAIDIVGKVQEIEYFKLSKAIQSWSATDVPITEETVKELDEDIFNLISKEVDEMNRLSKTDQKN